MSLWTINGTVPTTAKDPTTTGPGTGPTANPGTGDGIDVVKPAPNAKYVQCMSSKSGKPLGAPNGVSFGSKAGMSIDYCAAYAKKYNYRYFGVEYSKECSVGDVILEAAAALPALGPSGCNLDCDGDKTQKCGGAGALSFYNNTDYTPRILPQVKIPNTDITYEYRGCYKDEGGKRALGGAQPVEAAFKNFDSDATIETCLGFCNAGGYTWGGITYGKECYCNKGGIKDQPLMPKGDLDCSMACKGNTTQNCGNSGAIQAYAVKIGFEKTADTKRSPRRQSRRW